MKSTELLTSICLVNKEHVEIIFLLIGFSLFVALIFLFAFIWSVKTDQYDDEYGDSIRMLYDDETEPKNTAK